ncbi:prion-inhibition and propagation-domain-containing protein [Lasiosphaeris hirsuta]|uniref:Prion-inhibition and propagation-domain-containing protein n=1 Tax=Lasiosphaeris hirsuta TaxID=260670 RepID=A0AA40B000_9PEZI|nr:prion-inhibition and propagation-domain-containing protein [Lasiosphaeris hirsuta]
MEVAGLVLGTLGIAGLFKSCVENFDIVVRAKDFSEEFDLLCTQLSLQRVRLLIWGESLGLVPRENGKSCYNTAVDRSDIRPAIESTLHHLRNLLAKADVITGRYETQEGLQPSALLQNESKGMTIFKSKFDKFKARLRQAQKDAPTWKITRWSVHDYNKFRELITAIRELLDSLESITTALGLLQQQQAALVEEVESLSDTKSLRLLQTVASRSSASAALKAISDTASYRISLIESSIDGRSFHTALTHRAATAPSTIYSVAHAPNAYDAVLAAGADSRSKGKETASTQIPPAGRVVISQAPAHISPTEVPQHQRWMASLAHRRDNRSREHTFTAEDLSYGSQLKAIREGDEAAWRERSARLIQEADKGSSLAQRAFVELRAIRRAKIPFISASPVRDRLDCLLASVEGPPGTPYEGGVFWITVKLIPHKPPTLRFHTRIYHPNIDCTGKLCASFEEWWTDENLRRYMRTLTDMNAPWFSENRSNTFSLGAILVALCSLLASPNVDDPLVPEIAETYITNYDGYVRAARLYTMKYALDTNAPLDAVFADDDDSGAVDPDSVSRLRGADPAASASLAAASVHSASRPASFDTVSLGIDIRETDCAVPKPDLNTSVPHQPVFDTEATWNSVKSSSSNSVQYLLNMMQAQTDRIFLQYLINNTARGSRFEGNPLRVHPRGTEAAERRSSEATERVRKHGVPKKYFICHWESDQKPILLLNNAFDANSLGEWVFYWAVESGLSRGQVRWVKRLWSELIRLSCSMKLAMKALDHQLPLPHFMTVADFLASAERAVDQLQELVKPLEVPVLEWCTTKASALMSDAARSRTACCMVVRSILNEVEQDETAAMIMSRFQELREEFEDHCVGILDAQLREA